jgi:hypothetical protein
MLQPNDKTSPFLLQTEQQIFNKIIEPTHPFRRLKEIIDFEQFVAPQDWQKTTINGVSAFYVRITYGVAALSTGITSLTLNSLYGRLGFSDSTSGITTPPGAILIGNDLQRAGSYDSFLAKNCYWVFTSSTALLSIGFNAFRNTVSIIGNIRGIQSTYFTPPLGGVIVCSETDIEMSGESFLSINGVVFEFRPLVNVGFGFSVPTFGLAQVETAPWIVGANGGGTPGFSLTPGTPTTINNPAPYYNGLVPQYSSVPQGRFVKFIGNRLWLANLDVNSQQINWSGAYPAHRVWPLVSFAYVTGDDSSGITGLGTIGENLVVFKHASIWNMVSLGLDTITNLENYSAVKTVSGIGCVAHNSIQEMSGVCYFLCHDGGYGYDGTTAANVSERILPLIRTINPGRREAACSAHVHTENAYFLAVPTNGAIYNNTILVYRLTDNVSQANVYSGGVESQGSWWVWTLPAGTYVASMWTTDSPNNEEQLYFQDQCGNIYRMLIRDTDNGAAIVAKIETHDFLRNSALTQKIIRNAIIAATNEASSLTINVIPDGQLSVPISGALVPTSFVDVAPQGFVFNSSLLGNGDVRENRVDFFVPCKRFRVQIINSVKNQLMKLQQSLFGVRTLGRR